MCTVLCVCVSVCVCVCVCDRLYFMLQAFHLLSGRDERYLAAGLKLPVLLQYSPGGRGEETHRGELVVYVDGRQVAALPIEG